MIERIRRLHLDTRGVSLTELLVGTVIGALVMSVVATTIFTTNEVRLYADDRNQFAGDLSVLSMSFDRDGSMAAVDAPARSQTSATSCANAINLGFDESGTPVRYRTSSNTLERVGGSGARAIVRNVTACTWQTVQIGSGRSTILVSLTLTGQSGETVTQILRAAPRSW
jgi:hypothetical protein